MRQAGLYGKGSQLHCVLCIRTIMALPVVTNNAIIAMTSSDKTSAIVCTEPENKNGGGSYTDPQAADNPISSDALMQRNTDDNRNNYSYNKDYEAVLQIKQQLEGKQSKPMGHHSLPRFSIDWLFIRQPREYKLLIFVVVLFCLIISGLIVIYHFHEEDTFYIYRGPSIIVNEKTLEIEIFKEEQQTVLKGRLWRTRPSGRLPYDCSSSLDDHNLCLVWKNMQELHIENYRMNNVTCYNINWMAVDDTTRHMDCYQLDSAGHWYGAGLLSVQQWPLERASFNKQPFVTGTFHDRNSFGPIIERYWVTSSGVAIIVADDFPLHVSINSRSIDEQGFPTTNVTDRQLCLFADNTPTLNYTICVGDNARQVHRSVAGFFGDQNQYTQLPHAMLSHPIWSTWSNFKNSYNQSTLTSFARNIKSTQYNADGGLLLIDDGWEEHYGDMVFDNVKFTNSTQLINDLHADGFQVSIWLHPQLSTDSVSFQQATANGFLVRDITGEVPGLTRWWNGPHTSPWGRGVAGLVDVSDIGAIHWYQDRLINFQKKYGFDRIHLAGSETVSWPLHSTVFTHKFRDPNDFTHHFAKLVSSLNKAGEFTVIQSAYRCQPQLILARVTQGSSSWHDIGGLHSVIPSALSLGLIGYPFFIPEAIGGSAFNGLPSKELYIRWLELAVFLPIVHFSIPPDSYDAETVAIAKRMMSIHNELIVPIVINIISQSASCLSPIVRPLWWLSPTEHNALVTDTQFMVGNKVLVAPIIEQGARHRTIYLPAGKWEDQITGQLYTGPLSLHKYPAALDQIPYFIYSSTDDDHNDLERCA